VAHVDNLRRHFPAVRQVAYLNTGTFGVLPDAAVEAMHNALRWQLEEGRRAATYLPELRKVRQAVREELAQLFHVSSRSFALTESTTQAVNIVLWGLALQPGDEVIVTDVEHEGGLLPAFIQKHRRGVVVKSVRASAGADELMAAVQQAITPRTRLILCSHVSYATGHRLPIERLAQLAHAHHALILVDGAQGAGAEALDLSASDIDFYALPGQKWLCGPDGTGALYVHANAEAVLEPTYVGYPTLAEANAYGLHGSFLSGPDVARYEHTQVSLANWVGFLESLHMLRVTVGWDYAITRIHGLSGYLMDKLLDVPRVHILTPREARAGFVHFRMEGVLADAFVAAAAERSVDVKAMHTTNAVRVSTGFYNTEDDIDRLLAVLHASISATPR